MERLGELLAALKEETQIDPVVVLEATGHYHRGLAAYLERSGSTYYNQSIIV
nr:hypothetical protein [Paenibacillus sp. Leaf72]